MHRFFVDEPLAEVGQEVALPREEAEHAARVLRLRAGEEVRLLDGEHLCDAVLTAVNDKRVLARVDSFAPSPEAPAKAILLQGLPKADKLEWIVQKTTELGAGAIQPVEMERCVAKADKAERADKKRERLARIALEAAKQSGRAHVPEVLPIAPLTKAVDELCEKDNNAAIFVAWEEEHALPLSRALRERVAERGMPEHIALVIGPEGGISRVEYEQLAKAGAVAVTLGKRILRTETAGLCALAVVWAALGEM